MEKTSLILVPSSQLLVWLTQEKLFSKEAFSKLCFPLGKESPTQGMLETPGNNQRAGMKWEVEEKSCGTNKFVFL